MVKIAIEDAVLYVAICLTCMLVGAVMVYCRQGMTYDHMYDLIKKATSDQWIDCDSYRELYDEKKKLEKELKKANQINELHENRTEDLNRRCEALQTKIHCLEAELCKLKNEDPLQNMTLENLIE